MTGFPDKLPLLRAVMIMETNRLRWASRRGMLELDLILVPFLEQNYSALDATEKDAYRSLLECEDTELYDWLMAKAVAPRADHQSLIEKIRAFSQKTYRER